MRKRSSFPLLHRCVQFEQCVESLSFFVNSLHKYVFFFKEKLLRPAGCACACMLLHVCECICTCVYLHVERDAGLIWESSQVVLLSFSPRQALSNPELVNMLVLLGSSLQGPPPPRSCLLRLGLQMGHHTYRIYMSFWGYKPQSSNFHSKGSNH